MKKLGVIIIICITLVACTTDFPETEVKTSSLDGFIVGGDASGVYGEAGLLINQDSIQMTDWPMSRLVNNLNVLLDREYEDVSEFPGFYTIQMANTGQLDQIEFCDSIAATLVKNKLIK
jgi:hypothetical protein